MRRFKIGQRVLVRALGAAVVAAALACAFAISAYGQTSGAQPSPGAQPATGVQPERATQPATGAQPPSGAQLAPGAQPTGGEPVVAWVKLYLNDITKFDPATGFTADAFIGMRCETACGDPRLVVDNGKASARDVLIDAPLNKAYRMELTLSDRIDLHQYPFDSHRLTIDLVSARPSEEFRFAAAEGSVMIGQIRLQGWEIDSYGRADAWVAPFNPFIGRSVPVYRFSVGVSRPALAGILKVMLPGLAILLVGSLGLIVGPEERIKRFDLFNAAFLGTVLFQLNVLNSLPPLSYLTFADRFLLINLLSIILGVGTSIWIIVTFRSGLKARSWLIHEWSMRMLPMVWLSAQSLNALSMFAFEATDLRLWAIGAAELMVCIAILLWHAGHTSLASRFRAAYRRSLEQTRAPDQAIAHAIDTFSAERPLNTLTREELTALGKLFAPLPDPTLLVDVLVGTLRDGDASVLRDSEALERFTAFVARRKSQDQAPEPVPSPAV
jgi:hypothetical protein